MQKNNILLIGLFLLGITGMVGCVKKIDEFQSNITTINLNSAVKYAITSDVTVNPKDTIVLSFNVESPKAMKYISIQKNGTEIAKDTIKTSNGLSYATVKTFVTDSATGVYTYRILARDAAGVYLGDKNVSVTVAADFYHYTMRKLYVPDSVNKTNPCFFSTSTGLPINFIFASTVSSSIDFGYFYDTTTLNAPKHTIFAPNANKFAPYDLTAWTKNATVFKKITTPTWTNITSKGILRSTGIANLASGATSTINSTGISAGNLTGTVIIFKTAAGKYGALTVVYTNQNSAAKDTYIVVDVKIEK